MESVPDRIDSKFRFVLLAAARAEQLVRGARPKKEGAQAKSTRIAMEEIAEGLVTWDYGPPPLTEAPMVEGETAVGQEGPVE